MEYRTWINLSAPQAHPQKVGSKLKRCERACKRTAKAQLDFLRRGGATAFLKRNVVANNTKSATTLVRVELKDLKQPQSTYIN